MSSEALPSSALWNAEPIPPGSAGKGKTFSSVTSVPLAKRAVRDRYVYVTVRLDINSRILGYEDI